MPRAVNSAQNDCLVAEGGGGGRRGKVTWAVGVAVYSTQNDCLAAGRGGLGGGRRVRVRRTGAVTGTGAWAAAGAYASAWAGAEAGSGTRAEAGFRAGPGAGKRTITACFATVLVTVSVTSTVTIIQCTLVNLGSGWGCS